MVVKLAVIPVLMCRRNIGKKPTNSLRSVASAPILPSLLVPLSCSNATFTRKLGLRSENSGYPMLWLSNELSAMGHTEPQSHAQTHELQRVEAGVPKTTPTNVSAMLTTGVLKKSHCTAGASC